MKIHSPEENDFFDVSYDPTQIEFYLSATIYKTDKQIYDHNGDGIEYKSFIYVSRLEGELYF